jgi:hypothetical protein
MELHKKLFTIKNDKEFEKVALEIYRLQSRTNSVYNEYIQYLNISRPTCLKEIPFLPISFFKTHDIVSNTTKVDVAFKSSGTDGQRSTHLVSDIKMYIKAFNLGYDKIIGYPKNQVILALLPNYQEQELQLLDITNVL